MTLKEKMIRYRAANNLTQKQFADICGLSLITVNLIEAGKKKEISKMTEYKLKLFFEKGEKKDDTI